MVFIKLKDKEGIEIESKKFKDIDKEELECKKVVEKLKNSGQKILGFSLRRVIYTKTEKEKGLLKDLSLPDELSFWVKPLSRDFSRHEVWFEYESYERIFKTYKKLKSILSSIN